MNWCIVEYFIILRDTIYKIALIVEIFGVDDAALYQLSRHACCEGAQAPELRNSWESRYSDTSTWQPRRYTVRVLLASLGYVMVACYGGDLFSFRRVLTRHSWRKFGARLPTRGRRSCPLESIVAHGWTAVDEQPRSFAPGDMRRCSTHSAFVALNIE